MGYYNRYSEFIENGDFVIVPTIVLDENTSDKEVLYKVGRSRMDKISQQFYGVPYYGWLIMLANQSYGGQEWNIPDGTMIRVPFPLIASLEGYKSKIDQHFLHYGR